MKIFSILIFFWATTWMVKQWGLRIWDVKKHLVVEAACLAGQECQLQSRPCPLLLFEILIEMLKSLLLWRQVCNEKAGVYKQLPSHTHSLQQLIPEISYTINLYHFT
jgi:hypothetical protein